MRSSSRRISLDGNKLIDDVRLAREPSFFPAIAWSGAEFGVAWVTHSAPTQVFFTRIDVHGNKLMQDLPLRESPCDWPSGTSIGWSGTHWGISWSCRIGQGLGVYFDLLSADGVRIGSQVALTNHAAGVGEPRRSVDRR